MAPWEGLKVSEGYRNFQSQMGFLRSAIRNHPVMKDRDSE